MTDQPKAAADIVAEPEPVPPPPGWYEDDEGKGQRWWDGTKWSDARQPVAPAAAPARAKNDGISATAVLGYFLGVFAPIIGFIIGLALVARGDRHAAGVIITSIVFGILWTAAVFG